MPPLFNQALTHWPACPEQDSQHIFTCWVIISGVLANGAGGGTSRSVYWRGGAGWGRGRSRLHTTPRDNDVSVMTETKDKTHKASNVRMKTFIITPVIPAEAAGAKGHLTGIRGGAGGIYICFISPQSHILG